MQMSKPRRILVADDSVTIQKVVELSFLHTARIEISCVSDGHSAMEAIRDQAPDLLLADIHMPGPSGYDLCAKVKALNDTTAVLLLVGAFEKFDLDRYERCQADGVLEKPFDSTVLFGMVESLLNGRVLTQPVVLSPRRQLGRATLLGEKLAAAEAGWDLQIFLCHATQDKNAVRELYLRLQQSGFKPWLDEEDLLPGQDWDLAIRRALRESHVILVCLTDASVSKAGYVQQEIAHALDLLEQQPEGAIFLIPVQLEKCTVPDRLQHLHVADLTNRRGYNRLVVSLKTRAEDLGLAK